MASNTLELNPSAGANQFSAAAIADAFDALFNPERSGIANTNWIMYGVMDDDEQAIVSYVAPSAKQEARYSAPQSLPQEQVEPQEGDKQEAAPTYASSRDLFSMQERALIHLHRTEAASTVSERLRDQFPRNMHTYKQVKGALENERRKEHRREDNGEWEDAHCDTIGANLGMHPTELLDLLRTRHPGFRKNLAQVRDMKAQLKLRTMGGRVAKHTKQQKTT